jgi:hypothetical protein
MGASSEVPIFDWCNGHPTGWPFILWLGGLVSCGRRTCCVLEKGHNHNHASRNIILLINFRLPRKRTSDILKKNEYSRSASAYIERSVFYAASAQY